MAVADDNVEPSPPPARMVVAVLERVPFVLAPMLALVRVIRVAAGALPYLIYAVMWVFAAASAARIVAARAWGEGSAPFVFLLVLADAAFKVFLSGPFLFLPLAALLLCLAYVIAEASGSGSEFKKGALGALKHDSTRVLRTAVLAWVTSVPFMLLLFTGSLLEVMSSSPVEGSISKGKMILSVIVDVGVFANNAIVCFGVIPALALQTWRGDQSDRKADLPV